MAWFADLITSASVTGSDVALAVRLAGTTDPNSYIPVRIVGTEGEFADPAAGGPRVQSRLDDASAGGGFMYLGFADLGTASAATEWSIKRIEFDTAGDPIHTQWSSLSASWVTRVAEDYS